MKKNSAIQKFTGLRKEAMKVFATELSVYGQVHDCEYSAPHGTDTVLVRASNSECNSPES